MNATLERILHEVELVPFEEQCELTALLNQRFESLDAGDDGEIQAAWQNELDHRVADVLSGTAKTISGDEFEGKMQEFMANFKAGRNPAGLFPDTVNASF